MVFIWSAALLLLSATQIVCINPTARIASGVVIGTATSVSNQPSATAPVNAYLGVPFAKSPPTRFAPPVAPQPWSSPRVAQKVPPACLQQFSGSDAPLVKKFFENPGYPGEPAESEDCLYLNIWAPRDASPTNLKPVLFSVFGGRYIFGTGSVAIYNGSSLAYNQDVVVVTSNARTNIFGFSNSPELPFGTQNAGLLDQRFALSWVSKNIAAFGGDPSRVTLMGESSGGDAVAQILANPPRPLQFHSAILQSPAGGSIGNGRQSYTQTIQHFGCASQASPLACLRAIPAADLLGYITSEGLAFPPVNNDGTYLNDLSFSIASRQFANVPILIGTNAQEGAIYLALLGITNSTTAMQFIASSLGLTLPVILTAYPPSITRDPYTLAAKLITDASFTCPTSLLATQLRNSGYAVWRYLYSGSFPNITPIKCPNDGCAYHSSDLWEIFGTFPLQSFFGLGPATQTQITLSRFVQGIWAGWAKNPNAGPGWPRLGTAWGLELGNLGGSSNPTGRSIETIASRDGACGIFGPSSVATRFLTTLYGI